VGSGLGRFEGDLGRGCRKKDFYAKMEYFDAF